MTPTFRGVRERVSSDIVSYSAVQNILVCTVQSIKLLDIM